MACRAAYGVQARHVATGWVTEIASTGLERLRTSARPLDPPAGWAVFAGISFFDRCAPPPAELGAAVRLYSGCIR